MDPTERFNVPDTIVGIGGAGKEVVFQMMSVRDPDDEDGDHNEWIMREVMEPGDGSEGVPNELLQAFVVETEQEQVKIDVPRCNRINDRIGEMAESYDTAVYEPEINYINVVEGADVAGHELVSESVINDFAANTNLNCWWFGGDDIDTKENYSNGVVRRRALGKGLYYASRAGPDPIHELVRAADSGTHVDIVVGLGGGTGSGIFLDLARALENDADVEVTLFGIIPKSDEDTDIKANAYAALSELEYLSLTDQNPFRNIVLLPYGPAEDDTGFDEAVVNAILAHCNTRGTNIPRKLNPDKTAGPAPYAPFTVAVPQVIRFDAPGIKKSRENFSTYATEHDSIRETELSLYEDVVSFLSDYHESVYEEYDQYGSSDGYRLREEELDDLHERIDEVESLVQLDDLARSGYDAAPDIAAELDSLRNDDILANPDFDEDDHEERKRAVVNELPDTFVEGNFGRPPGGFDRSEDEELYDLVTQALETVRERRELFKAKNMLDSGIEQDGIEAALNTRSKGTPERRKVKAELDDANRSLSVLRDRKHDYELGEALATAELADAIDAWERNYDETVSELISLQENYARIDELLTDLDNAINSAATAVRDPDSDQVRIEKLNFDEFGELNAKLSEVGLSELSSGEIQNSVLNLRKARQAWLDAENKEGVLDRIGAMFENTDPSNRYSDARREIKPDIYEVADWGPDTNDFYVQVKADPVAAVQQELENHRDTLIQNLLDSLEEYIERPTTSLSEIVDRAESGDFRAEDLDLDDADRGRIELNDVENLTALPALGADPYDFESALDSALHESDATRSQSLIHDLTEESEDDTNAVYDAFYAAYVEPFAAARENAEAKLERQRTVRDKYSALDGVLETGIKLTKLYEDRMEPDDIPESTEGSVESGPYVKMKSAQDRGALLGRPDIDEAGLWDTEQSYIRTYIRDVAELVDRQSEYLPLAHSSISHSEAANPNYNQFAIAPVYMSRMFEDPRSKGDSARFTEIADILENGSIHLDGGGQYNPRRVAFGGPWDVSTTVFVGGVMADNLRPFRKEYRNAYESERRDLGDDGFIRHVHGLDGIDTGTGDFFGEYDGGFVHRDRLFNFNDDDDALFVLDNDEPTIVDRLLAYHDIERFDSKVPIGDKDGDE
ncbi:tubulin-like doman-containing protein [Halobellus litoreus]|mgnify:CR=1 FL=1|uniref:Tubulin-like doman-containing protein n=1 Tax=Halobellus litoreus TaxID=755310 RepID=A0ABD6DVX7_9EURY|nr:tubulin-like doman-containing protein [Halobellus litoreus]